MSDRNKEFVNNLVKQLLRLTGIKPKRSIPYSHQDNAIVERSIKEVRRHLAALQIELDFETPWSVQLPLVQFMMNNHENRSTGYTPMELKYGVYGKRGKSFFTSTDSDNEGHKNWISRMHATHARMVKRVATLKAAEDKAAQHNATSTVFIPGTFVLVEKVQRIKSNTAETFREGPFEVIKQEGDNVFLFDYRHEATLKEVHVSRCREFFYREEEDPRQLGAELVDKTIVERISDHKYVPADSRLLKSTFVAVKWSDEDKPRWEPLTNRDIRRTIAFVKYAQDIPELRKWIISVKVDL